MIDSSQKDLSYSPQMPISIFHNFNGSHSYFP